MRTLIFILAFAIGLGTALAQTGTSDPDPVINAAPPDASDAEIAARIDDIFAQIEALERVDATVNAGVVTLTGTTASSDAAERAESIVSRIDGVVTIENKIERDVSLSTRITPTVGQLETFVNDTIRTAPLIGLAATIFVIISFLGWLVSEWNWLWSRVTPNSFIAELVSTTTRSVFILFALVITLSILDATALLGAFLGAAGVLGLAIGFAVRDTIENYIASIMLSLRQPFRPNEHVVIDGNEGHVIRLTSRATILMTIDGNHLRIPNAVVFKAVILNYTRNPERRFEFELGVDANDDPLAAIETGISAISDLKFVSKAPQPIAFIKHVGDSNIVIYFAAWIDQQTTNFQKSRSIALAAAKDALESAGFALPEPIYRLRFDDNNAPALADLASIKERPPQAQTEKSQPKQRRKESLDVAPDKHLEEIIEDERRENIDDDLLSNSAPVE
ncbi:mechanosensitive ion channel domain-containing protein [Hyphococcus sp. DH-69]|uniref:mechanosensitive ion channel domain-containing protein n=1 Tax=Hyphococcus formosus TaxID=3143534 RepID=UPI00398B9EE8